jgi:hypothetical protein
MSKVVIVILLLSISVSYAMECEVVKEHSISRGMVQKCIDNKDNTTCFLYKHGYAGGISCIKD